MSSVETNQERQDNEFQVLQAIFGSDLVDLRKKAAWNQWTPLEVRITLLPQQGSSGLPVNHSKVDLHVKCGEEYPNIEPQIILENSRGLSNDLIKILKDELIKLTNHHKGEVMIFELTQHVQTFLHLHRCKSQYESFWDEMYGRKEKIKQQTLQAKQKKEDQERQEMKEEIQRRKEMLRSEPKIKKDQRRTSEGDACIVNPAIERTRSYSRKRCQSTSESSEGSHCEHRGTKLFLFTNKGERQVYRGRCIGHSERGSTLYAGLDMTTGDVVTINEWQLKIKTHSPRDNTSSRDLKAINSSNPNLLVSDLSQCMKFIANMEHELNFLTKLRHRNLVNYLNIKYIQENDSVMVYILQEYIIGISVGSMYLSENFSMECDILRFVAEEVLNALDFLHKNNVLHRDIRSSCVFIDKYGIIKVSDYSLDRRLYEFSTRVQNHHKNYSKKNDIYKFGLLLLSLIRGYSIDEHEKLPKIPVKLPFELRDFLNKCLAPDDRNRWTTAQLLKHNFIRARVERLSPARTLDTTPSGGKNSDDDSNVNEDAENDEDSEDIHGFIPIQIGGQSRIQNEFEILKWLGRGAFGDVLKVKNRLDGGCYAIKRIRLNPSNKQLNKKITREVKLLSRLNHENVVRYYNSWIESAVVDTSGSDKTSPETAEEEQVDPPKKKANKDLKGFVDDLEKLCPINYGVEWSISYESKSKPNQSSPSETSEDESTDDDDDDEWSCFGPTTTATVSDSSDGIEFEKDSSNGIDFEQSIQSSIESPTDSLKLAKTSTNITSITPEKNKHGREIQFMYIQMEFCEKSTLRTAIDKGLNKDVDRVWRLFREIVDGLSHIHQQGMIHRDLKPVNIFLDSNDHVKIGDFGLATSNIIPNSSLTGTKKNQQDITDSYALEIQITNSGAIGDGSLTGKVGTALYVAPELNTKASKAIYNQKVDIYSLGIILFEMAYAPLPTAMERVKVLANLRSIDITFPLDFSENHYARYVTVIRWLLNHDPSQRPTTQELLQSEHIPPPQIEESELQDLLRRTLANTQSKAYRYLIGSCFDQDITPAEDITYDMNNPKSTSTVQTLDHRSTANDKSLLLIENVKEVVIKIFKLHGGQCLSTPLLLPKSKYYDGIDSCVKMMTRSGTIVSVPHDLRVPFARYVARNSINLFKRYSIERVYREKKILGFQPRELYECAFDIITPNAGNLIAEAELLSIVYELIQEFPTLRTKNFAIRLNHTSLLRAVLLHGGIEEEKHNDIYSILADARDGKLSKFQVQTHLISLCLTDQAMMHVVSLMDLEITLKNAPTHLRNLLKRKGEVGILTKQGINDLETIIQNTENLGVKCNIVITPGLVYNVHQYSGMMCQFVCELKKKRRKGVMEVLAAGGRYDAMLNNFRSVLGHTGMLLRDVNQSGAGISISLDKLVQALQEEQRDTDTCNVDVLVCAIGSKPMVREKCTILKELWLAGIRCSLIDTNSLDEIEEQSRELNVTHSIILKENEQGSVLIRSWERDRFQERKVSTSEIVEFMQRLLKIWNDTNASDPPISSNILSRSESRTLSTSSSSNDVSPANVLPNTIVRFITTEKLASNTRRRYENQIMTHLSTKLQRLSGRCRVEILALNIESAVIRTMISYIDIEMESNSNYQKMFSLIIEKHPRHKKYLTEICDYLYELKLEKNHQVIILYSLIESYYKMIV